MVRKFGVKFSKVLNFLITKFWVVKILEADHLGCFVYIPHFHNLCLRILPQSKGIQYILMFNLIANICSRNNMLQQKLEEAFGCPQIVAKQKSKYEFQNISYTRYL